MLGEFRRKKLDLRVTPAAKPMPKPASILMGGKNICDKVSKRIEPTSVGKRSRRMDGTSTKSIGGDRGSLDLGSLLYSCNQQDLCSAVLAVYVILFNASALYDIDSAPIITLDKRCAIHWERSSIVRRLKTY